MACIFEPEQSSAGMSGQSIMLLTNVVCHAHDFARAGLFALRQRNLACAVICTDLSVSSLFRLSENGIEDPGKFMSVIYEFVRIGKRLSRSRLYLDLSVHSPTLETDWN